MVQEWYNKGLKFIYDLFDESTGKLHTKETLEATFNPRTAGGHICAPQSVFRR